MTELPILPSDPEAPTTAIARGCISDFMVSRISSCE